MSAVEIYLAKNEMEASIVRGKLDSVGINSTISPTNTNEVFHGYGMGVNVPYAVYVEEDKAEEAKKVVLQEK